MPRYCGWRCEALICCCSRWSVGGLDEGFFRREFHSRYYRLGIAWVRQDSSTTLLVVSEILGTRFLRAEAASIL